ncbi:hypothetical protein IRZ45_09555 [Pseudomonas aeruginosa]|uniref:hypothetical protein n=1 Tax=Pseudomonas aeruginosa TaxID=287 RepID=UPI0018AC45A5|nr:hypothetical protein [Pseudomonas aeruginosa]MBF8663772.1 hypothetical protein [Pseudomonas aeruginosa]MBF8683439.1 hypothetical protein [Pseudomonas aeruginosa]
MKFPFRPKEKDTDWDKEFGPTQETRKQRLIRKCQRHDVSIYTDDESEVSSGAYAELRGVTSEAELERRLNTKLSLLSSKRANLISIIALLVSLAALIASAF